MKMKYYIAYGSNLLEEQMKRRCPDSKVIGTAMLDGFELELQGTAAIVPKFGASVPVLIWEISELDEIHLDMCMGIHNGIYRKEMQKIQIDGKSISSMIYIKNNAEINLPKNGYIQRMFQGYILHGMNVNYLNEAILKAFHAQLKSHSANKNFSRNCSTAVFQYEEFFIRLTPEFLICQDENNDAEECEGFLIEILDKENSPVPLEIISAAKGYELSENSEKEAAEFAVEYLEEMLDVYRSMLKE